MRFDHAIECPSTDRRGAVEVRMYALTADEMAALKPLATVSDTDMADTQWIYEVAAALEAHDGERAAAFFAEDGRFEAVSVHLRLSGRSALAEMFGPGSDGFSTDDQLEVESAVSDGETFALQRHVRGTLVSDGEKYDYRGASVGQLRGWADHKLELLRSRSDRAHIKVTAASRSAV